MTQPLVSVFMPTYNHAEFIDAAIESVIEQDYLNLELVVGDDGSLDGTRERVTEWVKRYPDRILDVSGPHVGIVANCNRVLRACRGKYIAMTSGDDVFLPGKISRQVAWMEADNERVMCGHNVEAFDSVTGRTLYSTSETIKLTAGSGAGTYLSRMQLVPGNSMFLRASAVPPNGYDGRVGIVSDFKFVADVLSTGGKYGFVDGVLARYRVHAQSISQRSLREAHVARQYLEGFLVTFALIEAAHPDLIDACQEGHARALFGEARRMHRWGELSAARSYYFGAARLQPRRLGLKAVMGLALTYAPRLASRTLDQLLALRRPY